MTFDVVVRLPVSVPYGTDEDFDLRVLLEGELASSLRTLGMEQSVCGEIDTSHLNLRLDGIAEPVKVLVGTMGVLIRHGVLDRAVVLLETPSQDDPDERNSVVLWSGSDASASQVA